MYLAFRPVENVALKRVQRATIKIIKPAVLERWITLTAKSAEIIRLAEERAFAENEKKEDLKRFMLLAQQKWGFEEGGLRYMQVKRQVTAFLNRQYQK